MCLVATRHQSNHSCCFLSIPSVARWQLRVKIQSWRADAPRLPHDAHTLIAKQLPRSSLPPPPLLLNSQLYRTQYSLYYSSRPSDNWETFRRNFQSLLTTQSVQTSKLTRLLFYTYFSIRRNCFKPVIWSNLISTYHHLVTRLWKKNVSLLCSYDIKSWWIVTYCTKKLPF